MKRRSTRRHWRAGWTPMGELPSPFRESPELRRDMAAKARDLAERSAL